MKAMAIKMKTYVGEVNIVNNDDLRKRILNIMLMSLGALALCYVFILGNMIFNIVQRKTFESNARSLSNEVGQLELSYLSESNKIDLVFAQSMGFKEIKAKFATRKPIEHNSLGSIKVTGN